MNFRDKLQERWASEFTSGEGKGILHLCPRSDKTRTAIRIFCKVQRLLGYRPRILICYPDKNIQQSWESDFKAVGYKNPDITYVTHVSLKKEVQNRYDIIVCDEIHLLSLNQKSSFKDLMKSNPTSYILGLSGTLSSNTEFELKRDLGL